MRGEERRGRITRARNECFFEKVNRLAVERATSPLRWGGKKDKVCRVRIPLC